MKESAKAAFTWTRSHYKELGLKRFCRKLDVHIHVPEGAVPKDGLRRSGNYNCTGFSLTKIPVKRNVGMTEKSPFVEEFWKSGSKRKDNCWTSCDSTTIILPKRIKDMEDIPANIKKDIKFVFADNLDPVLSQALKSKPKVLK